jgi:hypothetical protein
MTFRPIPTVLAAGMLTAIGLAAPVAVDPVQGRGTTEQAAAWRTVAEDVLRQWHGKADKVVVINRAAVPCTPPGRPFCMDDRPERKPERLPYSLLPAELQTQLTGLIPADAVEIPDLGDGRIVLANPADIGEPPRHPDTWDLFYARYPGSAGYLLLTVPIFDQDRRQAAVATNHLFSWLGGKGELYLLVRDMSGKWTVKTRWPRWIS